MAANALQLILRRRAGTLSNALSLNFKRRLGQSPAEIGDNAAPKRRMELSGGAANAWQATDSAAYCTHITLAAAVSLNLSLRPQSADLARISRCFSPRTDVLALIDRCQNYLQDENVSIGRCQSGDIAATEALLRCTGTYSAASQTLDNCQYSIWQDSDYSSGCAGINTSASAEMMRCQRASYKQVVKVPCEYYPIPLPVAPPSSGVCPLRPDSSRLPLPFLRKKHKDSRSLALPFSCRDKMIDPTSKAPIAITGAYIMHNQISCSIDGKAVNILSANIKTDMASYCWQGEVSIAPADFAKIDRDKAKGDEPLIDLNINGTRWVFALEDVRDNRQFTAYSYSLSGRSITARLGADYAKTKTGVIKEALYARQIADSVLQYTDFTIGAWEIADWLIPADTYDLSGKSPLAVIADIAQAAGGFVESDKTAKKLYVKPRWQKPAWELAGATAQVIVPSSVIVSISGQLQTQPRYNAVRLHGSSKGKLIYRQNEDKALEAGVQHHALYTDDAPMIAQGIALLSESGKHKLETLKMPWHERYHISLAQLGELWQVNEHSGAWRGVVQGVSIEIGLEGDAPTLWQTVTLDRYMDK